MMQLSFIRGAACALTLAMAATLPQTVQAMTNSTFYGIVVHVSANNLKVQNPKTKETLSFLILPKFNAVYREGKTMQMSAIHSGQYVGVIYDQKALGARHADQIYLLTNANEKISAIKN
ncbi:MAG: hypothetical protein JO078_11050 [Candidatus Eremiobacteraeota bacterium]|nr:hypothetical protein [Candidatus Eremiobacteraeota bacterium]MBV9056589.1 hypothetical protein [Candidatus Eremiobacteraeota bacterium]MBV9700645.1 hypothetical protein [Candidatus Eremiobacteraeota bacterium]